MMGGGGLPEAIAAVARGEADTLVVLDNDLYRRAAALLVDDLLGHGRAWSALAALTDQVTARADVVLPTTTYAESTGTFVNNEGRAQRFFAVLEPREGVRDAWRWLRELMRLQGRDEGAAWVTVDDVIAALERELPQFRGVAAAAPGAGLAAARTQGRAPAAALERPHGDATPTRTVHEPAPVADPDSALAFSLEGLGPADAPAALLPRVWSPGWNSWNGLHKLQEEVDGPLRDGPAGVRLLDGRRRPATACRTPTCRAASLLARTSSSSSPAHHIFGSDDLSMYAPGGRRSSDRAVHRRQRRRRGAPRSRPRRPGRASGCRGSTPARPTSRSPRFRTASPPCPSGCPACPSSRCRPAAVSRAPPSRRRRRDRTCTSPSSPPSRPGSDNWPPSSAC